MGSKRKIPKKRDIKYLSLVEIGRPGRFWQWTPAWRLVGALIAARVSGRRKFPWWGKAAARVPIMVAPARVEKVFTSGFGTQRLAGRKWGKRDETKFFDARNSAETELSYGSKPSSTPHDARFLPHRL
jgi:hypothetical protein